MDIFAHGLWTGAGYRFISQKLGEPEKAKPFKLWLTVFWGIFPDLFAFTPTFLWLIWMRAFGNPAVTSFSHLDTLEPAIQDTIPFLRLAHSLYNISHSLIVFFTIFGLVWIFMRRPAWELVAWLVHILIDIPTHTYRFFPTPFLWPVSTWKFNGFSWGTPWFMLLNYSAIVVAYLWLRRRGNLNRSH